MSVVYEWQIKEVQTKTEGLNEDSVVSVEWIKRGTNAAGTVGEFHGTTPLTSAQSSSFTPFSDLTESTVLGWVQNAVSDETDRHNEFIDRQINLVEDPAASKPFPWAEE